MARKKAQTRRSFGAVRKLPSGRFQGSYTAPDTRRYTAPHTFSSKVDAEGWLSAERRLMDLGTWTPPDTRAEEQQRNTLTVQQWLDQFHDSLERRTNPVRPSTLQTYWRTVRNRITEPLGPGAETHDVTRLAGLKLANVTKSDVYRWWDGIQAAYPDTPQTNSKAYGRLKAAYAEAVRRELVGTSPVDVRDAAERVKPKEKYLPSDDELNRILAAVPERHKALTSLMLFHGLRIGEALALEKAHVVVDCSTPVPLMPVVTVHVKQNAQRVQREDGSTYMLVQPPKTAAGARMVPVMFSHVPLFLKHHAMYTPAEPTTLLTMDGPRRAVLFTATEKGGLIFDTSYRSILNRAEDRAGVTREIDPHCGRNWLITRLAEQGAHLKEIGHLLGQDDVTTILDVYMKVRAGRTTTLMEQVNASVEK